MHTMQYMYDAFVMYVSMGHLRVFDMICSVCVFCCAAKD